MGEGPFCYGKARVPVTTVQYKMLSMHVVIDCTYIRQFRLHWLGCGCSN